MISFLSISILLYGACCQMSAQRWGVRHCSPYYLTTPYIYRMQNYQGMNDLSATGLSLVFPTSLMEQLPFGDRGERPAIMLGWHIICEDIWEPYFLILLLQKWMKLVYKTYIFVIKLTYEQRFLWGMTSEEPAVLKDVCKWNSQSKKLTERAQHLSWRLHSLKVRTFWMHFKNWSVYKHKHSETCDAEFGGMRLLHIFSDNRLPILT